VSDLHVLQWFLAGACSGLFFGVGLFLVAAAIGARDGAGMRH
jgi:hypothetical protein